MKSKFTRFGGIYAVLAGVAGFLYSLAFIVFKSDLLSALFLLLGAFFASAALVALYDPTVLVPRGKKFEPILQAALDKGQITSELRTVMNDRAVRLAHLYEEIVVIVIVALMVLKPF